MGTAPQVIDDTVNAQAMLHTRDFDESRPDLFAPEADGSRSTRPSAVFHPLCSESLQRTPASLFSLVTASTAEKLAQRARSGRSTMNLDAIATVLDRLPAASNLLSLVQRLTRETDLPEEDLVDVAASLVNSGRVRLTGNFRGCRLEMA